MDRCCEKLRMLLRETTLAAGFSASISFKLSILQWIRALAEGA
jgi:hypothetical protein